MYNTFRLSQNEAIEFAKQYDKFDILIFHLKEQNDKQNQFLMDGIKGYQNLSVSKCNKLLYVNTLQELYTKLSDYNYIIIDQPYLKEHRDFVSEIYRLFQDKTFNFVENQTAVPIKIVSNKEEYSARTIRNKIWNLFDAYYKVFDDDQMFEYEKKARQELEYFIVKKLPYYHLKNDPSLNYTSKLSTYLKYGFISVSYIYQQVFGLENSESFLEELIIRRELAYNFVYYNKKYYDFNHITYDWAYQTMNLHQFDKRQYIYTKEDYILSRTHDPYFNQAMKNMVETGYMHGYMRMYWCKKIIEWSRSFEEAYQIAIELNNYYFLDGNTPNGYTGVAWCFGKHDRAWKEREIFGKLRYMNDSGLKRKFDMKKYLKGGV